VPDSASSEQTEKGSDELLSEITSNHEVMIPVFKDDQERAEEEQKVALEPTESEEG
jgi:hypothetical protein